MAHVIGVGRPKERLHELPEDAVCHEPLLLVAEHLDADPRVLQRYLVFDEHPAVIQILDPHTDAEKPTVTCIREKITIRQDPFFKVGLVLLNQGSNLLLDFHINLRALGLGFLDLFERPLVLYSEVSWSVSSLLSLSPPISNFLYLWAMKRSRSRRSGNVLCC